VTSLLVMEECKSKLFILLLVCLILSLWYLSNSFDTSLAKDRWGWVDQLVQETFRKTSKEMQWERQRNKTIENCKLNVNVLQNRKLALTCGKSL
jgi:hypothetical protein